ncbi:MAG: glycosyltransferase [Geminicoccaceae bacterium]|nr:glycosyltransferase [Geminicoccaceae bacterium]
MSWTARELFGAVELVDWPGPERPRLHMVIDTEESFDWRGPFRRDARDLRALRALPGFVQRLEAFGLVPTCVVTWPIAVEPDGRAILGELLAAGRIALGAHLHPWVTPPYEEPLGPATSYAGNLPPALEAAKLALLTERIGEAFGSRPTVYKAGRYGLGPATAASLLELGYRIDTSGYPNRDLGADGGPDFRAMPDRPFRFGPGRRLLELPMSCAWIGGLGTCRGAARLVEAPPARRFRLGGILARLRLLERVTLTPEGFTAGELRRLARALVARGHRVLCLSLHSPSLAPGNTPYAPDVSACTALVDRVTGVLETVLGELGGTPATARGLLAEAEATAAPESGRPCLSPADGAAGSDRRGSAG